MRQLTDECFCLDDETGPHQMGFFLASDVSLLSDPRLSDYGTTCVFIIRHCIYKPQYPAGTVLATVYATGPAKRWRQSICPGRRAVSPRRATTPIVRIPCRHGRCRSRGGDEP